MSFKPTPKQALALWGMIFGDTQEQREPSYSGLRKRLPKKERDQLVGAGLLETVKRGLSHHVLPTDAAWAWAAEHYADPLSESKLGAEVLERVLRRLGPFLAGHSTALAEFAQRAASGGPKATARLDERIKAICLDLAGGTRRRVRLLALRERLADVPRPDLDVTLLEMQRAGRLVLYPIDDPLDITPADESAALRIGGNPRHILYLEH
jgi:hypothetical protein